MADEGFHEIQLNGKQLVFLFMAATVVAVVIFLCGVMVGRGVRAQRGGELAELSTESTGDPTADGQLGAAAPAAPSDGAPPSTQENLTYPNRLEGDVQPPETMSESADSTPDAAPEASAPPPEPVNAAAENAPPAAPPTPASTEPSGDGFAVQVAAVRDRAEADSIARRLVSRGFPAYVINPTSGSAPVFRVRVGKFKDRREAETVASRLEKQEQFKPWITR